MTNPTLPRQKQLAQRIGRQILAVVIIALAMSAYLNYSNFDKTQRQLAESRVMVAAGDVRRAIGGMLVMGLSLEEISNLPEIMKVGMLAGQSGGMTGLAVLDQAGQVIAQTHADYADWQKVADNVGSWPIEREQNQTMRSLATDTFAIGIPLSNAVNEQVGWLVIDYDGSSQLAARKVIRTEILRDFAISGLLAAFLIMTGSMLLTRRFIADVGGLRQLNANDMPSDQVDPELAGLDQDYRAFLESTAPKVDQPHGGTGAA